MDLTDLCTIDVADSVGVLVLHISPMAFKMLTKTSALQNGVKFPQRLKGTIVERWANFWKNLFIDYTQMLADLKTDMQDNPRKALYYIGGLSTAVALNSYNPTELDFKEELRKYSNELILVSEETRNPKTIAHLDNVQRFYNQGVIRHLSLGVASIMYTTKYNEECKLFEAQCAFTAPTYASFPSRIVDIGFMGKWWNMFMQTCNYDINPQEVINHPN